MKSSNKVLILGGSVNQLPTIEASLKMGLEVHVTDNIAANPGHVIACASHNIDTTDIQKIKKLTEKEGFIGILSPCTDVAVLTAAEVAHHFNLNGVPVSAAKILTSKLSFRKFQKKLGIPHPAFNEIDDKHNKPSFNSNDGIVIKPDKSSGSKGISILDKSQLDKLDSALIYAIDNSINSKALAEEALKGHHGTLEGVIQNGEITHAFFLDRQTENWLAPHTIGHRIPSLISDEFKFILKNQLDLIFSTLNIKDSVFDVDFIVSDGKIFIIEMSPRLGGNSISNLLLYATKNLFNFPELAVSMATSSTLPKITTPKIIPTSVTLLGSSKSGILSINQEIVAASIKKFKLHNISFNFKDGDLVNKFETGRDVVAVLFFSANDIDTLDKLEKEIRSTPLFSVN